MSGGSGEPRFITAGWLRDRLVAGPTARAGGRRIISMRYGHGGKKAGGASRWVDPDEAPPLDRAWFERAEVREGKLLIRPTRGVGRPRKAAVGIRLDPDVLAHFRAGGPGWQSRINQALRKAAGL